MGARLALFLMVIPVSSCMRATASAPTTSSAWVAGGTSERVSKPLPPNDPITTDGDKYRVILENAEVRVLRYRDKPGAKTNSHHHPRFVLYALTPFQRRLTFGDGTTKSRGFRAGDVIFMNAQTHIGENIGTTDTDVVIVEMKTARPHTGAPSPVRRPESP